MKHVMSPVIDETEQIMEVFDSLTIAETTKNECGLYSSTPTGVSIVFGSKGNTSERYVTIVSLSQFDFSQEEIQNGLAENLDYLNEWINSIDVERIKLGANRIALKDVYPEFDPDRYTKLDELDYEGAYFPKRRQLLLLRSNDIYNLKVMKSNILFEVRVCEILKRSPHPNLASYLGCVVDHGRITGICYELVESSLEYVAAPLDVEKYVADVRKGLEHLHSLGLSHNDISPSNILVREDNSAVIIDFDACLPVGEKLHKWAPDGFARDSAISDPENDWFGLRMVEAWMVERNEEYEKSGARHPALLSQLLQKHQ